MTHPAFDPARLLAELWPEVIAPRLPIFLLNGPPPAAVLITINPEKLTLLAKPDGTYVGWWDGERRNKAELLGAITRLLTDVDPATSTDDADECLSDHLYDMPKRGISLGVVRPRVRDGAEG